MTSGLTLTPGYRPVQTPRFGFFRNARFIKNTASVARKAVQPGGFGEAIGEVVTTAAPFILPMPLVLGGATALFFALPLVAYYTKPRFNAQNQLVNRTHVVKQANGFVEKSFNVLTKPFQWLPNWTWKQNSMSWVRKKLCWVTELSIDSMVKMPALRELAKSHPKTKADFIRHLFKCGGLGVLMVGSAWLTTRIAKLPLIGPWISKGVKLLINSTAMRKLQGVPQEIADSLIKDLGKKAGKAF